MWLPLLIGLASAAEPASDPADAEEGDDVEVVEVDERPAWRPRQRGAMSTFAEGGRWGVGGGDLEDAPGAGADVSRALQLLPPIQATRLRSTGLSIHGAAPGEAVWSIEGVPLQSPRSSGTIFSRVPSMAVEGVQLDVAGQADLIPGAAFGNLDFQLVEPSDSEWDGTLELTPVMAQAQVAAPLGRRDRGNALLVGGRRTFLEPAQGWLGRFGLGVGDDWTLFAEDVWMNLRIEPASGQRLDVVGWAGRSRNAVAESDDDARVSDTTSTALLMARYRAELSERFTVHSRVALTHEVQDIDDQGVSRRDARTRSTVAADVIYQVRSTGIGVRGELAPMVLTARGEAWDSRVAPPWTRVAWRKLDPGTIDFDLRASDAELSALVGAWTRTGRLRARASARTSLWSLSRDGGDPVRTATVDPSVLVELRSARSIVSLAGAVRHQRERDPLLIHPDLTTDLRPTRVGTVALSAQHRPAERAFMRLDGWFRRSVHLAAWAPGSSSHQRDGEGRAVGVDALVGAAYGPVNGALSGSLAWGERESPDVSARMPGSLVPWSVQALGGLAFGSNGSWNLGLRGQVRAGVLEVPVVASVLDDAIVYAPDPDGAVRRSPQGRVGVRLAKSWEIAEKARVTAYVEGLVTRGPISEREGEASVGPDGELVPGEARTVLDPGFLPWAGVRARF